MYAHINDGLVVEIINMTPEDFAYYYPEDFRALCVPCDATIRQGWSYDGVEFRPPAGPALEEVRAAKLAEVMAGYSAAFAPIEAIYPREERETWPIQLEEARAVLADPDAETPMLSIMVAVRGKGETIAEFAGVVMANNTMYRQFAAYITGQQQRMYAEVNAMGSMEAVAAYEVRYIMPPELAAYLGG